MERQQKAYKGVIDYFKKKILDGELRPGEKLPPERDIAERLNVSRNSVREAIRIMDMTGVISSQQGSGNYITCEFQKSLAETMTMMFAMDQIDYRQISQIRQALECLAFSLAIENATDGQIEEMEKAVKELDRSQDDVKKKDERRLKDSKRRRKSTKKSTGKKTDSNNIKNGRSSDNRKEADSDER